MAKVCGACGGNIDDPMHKYCMAWKNRNSTGFSGVLVLGGAVAMLWVIARLLGWL